MKCLLIGILFSLPVFGQTHYMESHVLRLKPGQDVYQEITKFIKAQNIQAASIISVVGSLTESQIRFANKKVATKIKGPLEVLSLSGTTSVDGTHLHIAVADGEGKTLGGHLVEGNKVYTTLELVIAEYYGISFKRKLDPASGYNELSVEKLKN